MAAAERRTRPAQAAAPAAKSKQRLPRKPSPRPARHDPPAPAPLALAVADRQREQRERVDRWVREWGGNLARDGTAAAFRRSLWEIDPADVREATYRLMTDHVRPWRVAKAMVPWAAVADLVAVMRERGLAREVEKGWADAEVEWEQERLS